MKKSVPFLLLVLCSMLSACSGKPTDISADPSLPPIEESLSPAPSTESEPPVSETNNTYPVFERIVNLSIGDDEPIFLSDEERTELWQHMRVEDWVIATGLPIRGFDFELCVSEEDGVQRWFFNPYGEQALIIPSSPDKNGEKTCYFAPADVITNMLAYAETLTPSPSEAMTTPPAVSSQAELPSELPSIGKWAPTRDTGNAKTLTGNCVVFMFFLSDEESTVDEATRADYLRYMKEADDFLSAQAAANGQTLNLLYGEDDLLYAYTSSSLLPSEIGFSLQMLTEAQQGVDFEAIAARYGADQIAYVLWLNKRGDFCYANQLREYTPGVVVDDYAEVCVMYTYSIASNGERYPMASASVLTHELLHLFGAVDLLPGMNRTDEVNELLNSVYISDLMRYGTGNLSEKTLSEMDLYLIGWVPSLADDLWQCIDYVEL